jgi:hypothetical protein
VVEEVRRQFREKPGIMLGTDRPDYARAVDLLTRAAIKEMVIPSLLPVLSPIVLYFVIAAISGKNQAFRGGRGHAARRHPHRPLRRGLDDSAAAPGTTPRSTSRTATTAARARTRTRRRSPATPSGTPTRTPAGPAVNPAIKITNIIALSCSPSWRTAPERSANKKPRGPLREVLMTGDGGSDGRELGHALKNLAEEILVAAARRRGAADEIEQHAVLDAVERHALDLHVLAEIDRP